MNFLGDNVKLLNNLVDDYINGEYGLEYNWYWFTYLLFYVIVLLYCLCCIVSLKIINFHIMQLI